MARTSVLLKMQRLTDCIRYVKEHPEGADENTLAALWKCGRSTVYDRIRELNKETEEPLIVKAGRGRYTVNEELTPYVVLFDVKMVREWLILYLLQESGEKGLSRSQLETKYRELCAGIEDMAIAGEADYQDLDSDMKASGITLYGDLRQLCESGLVRLAGMAEPTTIRQIACASAMKMRSAICFCFRRCVCRQRRKILHRSRSSTGTSKRPGYVFSVWAKRTACRERMCPFIQAPGRL